MASHNDLGKQGEEIAKKYLTENGYEVLDENWTYGKSEVDLIVYKNAIMIFVEVKTRSSVAFGDPEAFVNKAKQKQMELASTAYIEIMNHQNDIRFDIIAITFTKNKNYTLKHIEDAFWPED
ncbi:YraN family protein [Pedobacter sandarakinus]|uniref:YraN family protein n=1 Tax=Pedobacter sandarakinus TaxID=353156 RepID=UPI0022462259|nr:YraN family protein [Pedobacter sandarakinus]MCX2573310.1 YraN family protein [Pedobacter sandarakinus]